MTELILCTTNEHKRKELEWLLANAEGFAGKPPIRLRSLKDIGFTDEIEENGFTFEENALIKAEAVFRRTGLPCIADDSGICVDALGGAPGIDSAHYAGPQRSDCENNEKLLEAMKDIPDDKRTARFVCAMAFIDNGGSFTVRGECEGLILRSLTGNGGFGYDPLFYYPPLNESFGMIPPEIKNRHSHRAAAARLFLEKFYKI